MNQLNVIFSITLSLTNLKVYKYYNSQMRDLVTVSQNFFSYFLSQLGVSSIHPFTSGFRLPAANGKAKRGNGPFETKRKDCHSQTSSYFSFEYKHTI